MSANYREINYTLRPAKNIERKMLCEAFHRLSPFAKIDSYRYIGLGSTYFSDFVLFHKLLNICQMTSIEKDGNNKERFLFNIPFNCIKVEFGHSNTILPKTKFDCRSIVWLDLTEKLKSSVLKDVSIISSKIASGSVFLITLNAEPDKFSENNNIHERLESLKKEVGVDKVPADLKAKDFSGWGTSNIYRMIINNQIEQTLAHRNGVLSPGSKMKYKQIFYFHYKDGGKMMTTGGIFYDEGQQLIFEQCGFKLLDFYRDCDEGYKIDVPCLTFKEIRRLDEQLPKSNGAILELPNVPQADIEKYEKIYRYFPAFAETNF